MSVSGRDGATQGEIEDSVLGFASAVTTWVADTYEPPNPITVPLHQGCSLSQATTSTPSVASVSIHRNVPPERWVPRQSTTATANPAPTTSSSVRADPPIASGSEIHGSSGSPRRAAVPDRCAPYGDLCSSTGTATWSELSGLATSPRRTTPSRVAMSTSAVTITGVLLDSRPRQCLDDVLYPDFGVTEQHLRVLAEEQRVLHTGIARIHAPLEHDDVTSLPHLEDRHARDRAGRVLERGRVDRVVRTDDQHDIGVVEVGVDLVHLEHDVVRHLRLGEQHVHVTGEATRDRVDAEPYGDAHRPELARELGHGVLRLRDRHAVPRRDDHRLGLFEELGGALDADHHGRARGCLLCTSDAANGK